jgi:hypothetical protein
MLHPAMAKSYQSSILQLAWNTIVGFMVLNVLEVLFATKRPALPNVVPKVEKAEILFLLVKFFSFFKSWHFQA